MDSRFWRMLSVRWQREPLSGAGAARVGGRWNRSGQAALYLAADHATAIAEFHQSLVMPGTLVGYDVRSAGIVDLTSGATLDRLGIDLASILTEWRTIVTIERDEPPSWGVADRLIAAGLHGALVPSAQRAGGINLVLWRWSSDGDGSQVRLLDPRGDLS